MVIVLTLVLAGLTGTRVFTAELWGDELRTWRDGIEKPLVDVVTWRHNPDHAPLGHLLARSGASLFGVEHPWALRLGAWLCGLACVPALWWMGRTLWDGTVGLAMAAMAVVDPNLALQMSQARMYAPLLLAVIVALTLAGSILIRPEENRRRQLMLAIGLGIAIGVGIWTHAQIYAVVIATLITAMAMVTRPASRRVGVMLLLAIVIGGAIGAPGIAKIASRHDAETIVAAEITDAPGGQLEDAVHKLTGKAWISYVVLAAFIGGIAIVCVNRPMHRWLAMLLSLVVLAAIVNLLIAARYRPVAHARYLTVLEPSLWFAIAVAVVDIFRTHRSRTGMSPAFAWGTMALWIGLCLFQATRLSESREVHPLSKPFADAARMIRRDMAAGDRFAMVARSPYGMYTRYYGLKLDDAIDNALTPSSSARIARSKAKDAAFDRGVIWLLCVVPPPNIDYRYALDEPQRAIDLIISGRGLSRTPLKELERTDVWHAAIVRIDGDGAQVRKTFP